MFNILNITNMITISRFRSLGHVEGREEKKKHYYTTYIEGILKEGEVGEESGMHSWEI